MDVETVTRQILLDGVLIPRANGSDGLERVEDFLATTLEASGAEVDHLPFTATPFGLQLAWTAAFLLMVGCVASTIVGWYPTTILLALAVPALLLAEFELLWSPVSGLFKRELIGADRPLGLVSVDGFALRRFSSPPWLVEMINDTAREALGSPSALVNLPAGTLTDGRSFLARGVPAVTLITESADGIPRRLHSSRDNRDRLSKKEKGASHATPPLIFVEPPPAPQRPRVAPPARAGFGVRAPAGLYACVGCSDGVPVPVHGRGRRRGSRTLPRSRTWSRFTDAVADCPGPGPSYPVKRATSKKAPGT